ncbi:hypothetical protein PoB_003043900 [Plakobranchus ocellatus]|uniref:Uncharacterized protein n=1 Tax=Plakobranchus ocellatus TaxID=259542 RepID=A0AAV4A8I7_9GAST|nr:hypothetical protein PoB_003043900 [Plakobranchus ocellatus]
MDNIAHKAVVSTVLEPTAPAILLMGHVTRAVRWAISLHSVIKFVIVAVMDKTAHRAVVSTVLELTAPAVLLMGHVTRAVSWVTSLHSVIKVFTS